MSDIRPIREPELGALLELYQHLHPTDPLLDVAGLRDLWQKILADPHLHYLVAEADGRIVSTCTLTVIPNLTRGAKPYAVIENVVTHPDYRRRGLGTRVLQAAVALAWQEGCYKVMLLTGRKDEATLRFYEKVGFEGGVKTAFLASRPR